MEPFFPGWKCQGPDGINLKSKGGKFKNKVVGGSGYDSDIQDIFG